MRSFDWLKPIKLPASESYTGCALDYHQLVLGARTYVGEMVYQMKYRGDVRYVRPLADMMVWCIKRLGWHKKIEMILGVPSTEDRDVQPVRELTKVIAKKLRKKYSTTYISIAGERPPMKSVRGRTLEESRSKKVELLTGKIQLKNRELKDKTVLLVDDIYKTGATLEVISRTLLMDGEVRKIYAVVATRAGRFGVEAYKLRWPMKEVD